MQRKRRLEKVSSFSASFQKDLCHSGIGYAYSFAFDSDSDRLFFNDWISGKENVVDANDIFEVDIFKNKELLWYHNEIPGSAQEIIEAICEGEPELLMDCPGLTKSIDVKFSYLHRDPNGNSIREITVNCLDAQRDFSDYLAKKQTAKAVSILKIGIEQAVKIALLIDLLILHREDEDKNYFNENPMRIDFYFCQN